MKIWESIQQRKQLQQPGLFVVAGLGNPGREYAQTKHNVGFSVIDRLAQNNQITVTKFKHKAFIGDGIIKGQRVLLLKPQTYMNLSGESVQEVLRFYKVPITNFMVIYDDTSLPVGAVRMREKGSAGGHNGIKNIISHLGTEVFLRFKVGIGEKPNGWDLADYVLAPFTKDELPLIESGIEKAEKAVLWTLELGVQGARNKMSQEEKSKKQMPDSKQKIEVMENEHE